MVQHLKIHSTRSGADGDRSYILDDSANVGDEEWLLIRHIFIPALDVVY